MPDEHPWPVAELPAAARRSLLTGASERHFATDEVIYLAGDRATRLYLVLEGRVRLMRGRGGRAVFIHDELAGGVLGEVPLFEGSTYPATAIAGEPTRCLALERDRLLDALRSNPELSFAVLARFAGRIRMLVQRIDGQATRTALARLATFLIERSGAVPGRSFTLGASQQHAAEEIGTVREVVVRGLKRLRERGAIVSRGGGRYAVLDPVLLRSIADDSEP